jgi:transcriptional regulator NrdR family protein
VYRSFRDIAEFMSELKELLDVQARTKERKVTRAPKVGKV